MYNRKLRTKITPIVLACTRRRLSNPLGWVGVYHRYRSPTCHRRLVHSGPALHSDSRSRSRNWARCTSAGGCQTRGRDGRTPHAPGSHSRMRSSFDNLRSRGTSRRVHRATVRHRRDLYEHGTHASDITWCILHIQHNTSLRYVQDRVIAWRYVQGRVI